MDREHAKFILQSYRPDGADANDQDFAEALKYAAEDREIGQWLAQERAHDAMFAEALCAVNIPDGLRDELLSVMEYDKAVDVTSELDGLFVGAMADVTPPAGLRDQIISAMEVERESLSEPARNKVIRFPMKWLNVAAIAALLVLGTIFWSSSHNKQVDMHLVQIESGNLINATQDLEFTNVSLANVNSWLEEAGLPVASTIPKGLISMDTEGGKKLLLDNGVEASMIFFKKKEQGKFYLMVLKVDSVEDFEKLQSIGEMSLKRCASCPVTHFNVITWKDNDKAYMLLSNQKEEVMMNLF